MSQLQIEILTDSWIQSTWDEYLQVVDKLNNKKAKGYYHNGYYKLEMAPIGFDHSCNHAIIMYAVNLYATLKRIDLVSLDSCSYRRIGIREAQPDASYYIGKNAGIIPYGTSIINLDQYPAPDLVIEISKTTLADDLGNKRLLYEDLGVSEYWVIDVQKIQVIAFHVAYRGSYQIDSSQVLPGLEISLLSETLSRNRQNNHSSIGQWLIEQLQI